MTTTKYTKWIFRWQRGKALAFTVGLFFGRIHPKWYNQSSSRQTKKGIMSTTIRTRLLWSKTNSSTTRAHVDGCLWKYLNKTNAQGILMILGLQSNMFFGTFEALRFLNKQNKHQPLYVQTTNKTQPTNPSFKFKLNPVSRGRFSFRRVRCNRSLRWNSSAILRFLSQFTGYVSLCMFLCTVAGDNILYNKSIWDCWSMLSDLHECMHESN